MVRVGYFDLGLKEGSLLLHYDIRSAEVDGWLSDDVFQDSPLTKAGGSFSDR